MSTGSLLHDANFRRLWSAQAVSQLGTRITQLALPLAGALVLGFDPAEMALLTALSLVPYLVVSLPVGVLVDRVSARPLLVGADLCRAATLGLIPIAFVFGALTAPLLYSVALITGIASVVYDVAYQSLLPGLVTREQLVDANSKLEIARSGAAVVGPSVAGPLISVLSAPVAIALDALSYVVSAGLVVSLRTPDLVRRPRPSGDWRHEIVSGFAVLGAHRVLIATTAATLTGNFFNAVTTAVFVLFALQDLALDPAALGLVFAAGNVGFLLASLSAPRLAREVRTGNLLIVSMAVWGLSTLLAVAANPTNAIALLIASKLLGTYFALVYNINQLSLRQAVVPRESLGRVTASVRLLVLGPQPIGALVGGALAVWLGLRDAYLVGSIGMILACVWLVTPAVRAVRSVEQLAPTPQPGRDR